jgi:long-subunit acyl-CoA synthetase (AMP-forming)
LRPRQLTLHVFQPENNMVTAAQKLNRTVIVKKHKKEIDAMIAKQ